MSKIYVGIDPGQSGGIAFIKDEKVIALTPMILAGKFIDVRKTAKYINDILNFENAIACIEFVHAMPKQGVSSSFKFGFVTGTMHGIIGTLGISLHMVTPQKWKKEILEGTAKDKNLRQLVYLLTFLREFLFSIFEV